MATDPYGTLFLRRQMPEEILRDPATGQPINVPDWSAYQTDPYSGKISSFHPVGAYADQQGNWVDRNLYRAGMDTPNQMSARDYMGAVRGTSDQNYDYALNPYSPMYQDFMNLQQGMYEQDLAQYNRDLHERTKGDVDEWIGAKELVKPTAPNWTTYYGEAPGADPVRNPQPTQPTGPNIPGAPDWWGGGGGQAPARPQVPAMPQVPSFGQQTTTAPKIQMLSARGGTTRVSKPRALANALRGGR